MPQEFRTYEIFRNTDNSISIRVTTLIRKLYQDRKPTSRAAYAVGARGYRVTFTNLHRHGV